MSSTTARSIEEYAAKDYKSDLKPIWCPACGDYGVVPVSYTHLTLPTNREV